MISDHNFCVFILSHGRPSVKTVRTLRKHGYTGDIKIIIDNEDKRSGDYIADFGDDVIVFNKAEAEKTVDMCDSQTGRNVVVIARNEAPKIAKELGYEWFLVLDDDYSSFRFTFDRHLKYSNYLPIKSLDDVFDSVISYMSACKKITCTAMAQGGDFIGGPNSGEGKNPRAKRKIMNSFFCHVDRPFDFMGRINEDTNAYVTHGRKGVVMHQINQLRLEQGATQQNDGGLTDIYLNLGTYVKSFYSVIVEPSCVKVSAMGDKHKRFHHKVDWNSCTPKILRQSVKDGSQ